MRLYHVCECCDRVFKMTETNSTGMDGREDADDLTGVSGSGIMLGEPETGNNNIVTGLCDDCREEVYGPPERLVYPYRLN